MASDVMSLFGMDPNMIQQNRVQKGVDNASRMSADYAIGAAGGQMLGAGINSAFGLQTPDMAQAASVQSGLEGADLNTAAGLRNAAQQLMMNGDYAQAMALHAQARGMEEDETTATNLKQDRSLGKSSNVIVKQSIAPDPKNPLGVATPAVQHSIIKHVNGRVVDVTQGREFATEAEWIASIAERYGPEAAKAIVKEGDSTVTGLSPFEIVGTPQGDIDATVTSLEEELLFTNDEDRKNDILQEISNVKAGDPSGNEQEIVTLVSEAQEIYNELRSGGLKGYELQQKAVRLGQLKAQVDTLGMTSSEISQLSKVTP